MLEDIESLRRAIDEIDSKLVELLEERMNVVSRIGRYKSAHNLPVLNEERESLVISRNLAKIKDRNLNNYIVDFLKFIISLSRNYQESMLQNRDGSEL